MREIGFALSGSSCNTHDLSYNLLANCQCLDLLVANLLPQKQCISWLKRITVLVNRDLYRYSVMPRLFQLIK